MIKKEMSQMVRLSMINISHPKINHLLMKLKSVPKLYSDIHEIQTIDFNKHINGKVTLYVIQCKLILIQVY